MSSSFPSKTTATVILILSIMLLLPCLIVFVHAFVTTDFDNLVIWGILILMMFASIPAYIGIAAAVCTFKNKPQARGLSMASLVIFGGLTCAATLAMVHALAIEQSLAWEIENIAWLCINAPLSMWCIWQASRLYQDGQEEAA